jgi:hypothetical protein
MRWLALKIYLITSEEGFTKVQFRKSTSDRAKPWRLFGPNFKWEGATRGARLAGAVLFDPAPGRALVRACAGKWGSAGALDTALAALGYGHAAHLTNTLWVSSRPVPTARPPWDISALGLTNIYRVCPAHH